MIKKKQTRTQIIEAAKANGDYDKLIQLQSAMILLFSVAEGLKGDAEEIEARSGIAIMELKMSANKLTKAFDDYRASYRKLVSSDAGKMLIADFEDFDKQFRSYAKLANI